jgi:hypothetical protein
MGFQNGWRGPNIVSDGLVLYLDAGSPNSYRPDFGTTWKDMSGNNYSGSLINGSTYSTASGGSIVFDGVDDYMITQQVANFRSISMFLYKTETGPIDWKYILDARPGMSNGFFANLQVGNWTNWYLNGSSIAATYANLPTNQWFHLYIQADTNYTSTINFMSRVSNNEQMGGRIGQIQIYNRILSDSEILQNYNAQKSRFGL